MSGIREDLLKTDKHDVKVRFFRGGTIEDMEDIIKPILKREPDNVILHVGTNIAINLTAHDILEKLLRLKSTILDARKSCKVIISQPNIRSANGKAAPTNHQTSSTLTLSRTVTSAADTLKVRNYISILVELLG